MLEWYAPESVKGLCPGRESSVKMPPGTNSGLAPRPMRRGTTSAGGLPWWRTATTCSAMGISTPTWAARSTTAADVRTPSATIRVPATMSARLRPLLSCSPTHRLRLWRLVQVATRSPMPVRPEKVTGCPPRATPRRASSARPRVTTAPRVLSPKPMPSAMPAAMAMTFLRAPPELAADDVGVGVDPEAPGGEQGLELGGQVGVGGGHHAGGGLAGHDLVDQVGPGEHGEGLAGHELGHDLAHAAQGHLLDALGEADDRRAGAGDVRPALGEDGPEAVGRDGHDHHVGPVEGLGQDRRSPAAPGGGWRAGR